MQGLEFVTQEVQDRGSGFRGSGFRGSGFWGSGFEGQRRRCLKSGQFKRKKLNDTLGLI
jgi:hypothetical protein